MLRFFFIFFCSICTLLQGQDSTATIFHPNGSIAQTGKLFKGKKSGQWSFYYPNGNLMERGNYRNDKKEGEWKIWWDNGQPRAVQTFENNQVNGQNYSFTGTNTYYYKNGQKKEAYNFTNGLQHGFQYQWYPNGRIKAKSTSVDGLTDGIMYSYYNDSSSTLKGQTTYTKGIPTGVSIAYFTNGSIESQGPDENGLYEFFDSTGNSLGKKASKEEVQLIWDLKPVLYLYADNETEFELQLNYNGRFTFTYPTYINGWQGTIMAKHGIQVQNQDYPYLFWEGQRNSDELSIDYAKGFCIEGTHAVEFLDSTLSQFGFNSVEKTDFITFWGPRLQQSKWNFIHFFINETYNQIAGLNMTPSPDNSLRVYMNYSPLEAPIKLSPQELPRLKRSGVTLLEWGGGKISSDKL